MKEKGVNKPNKDAIIKAFFSQRLAVPHTAPLHHYDVLFSAGLIDIPYTIEDLEGMACECVLRLLTIDIDNYAASIRPLVEKPNLTRFEQLKYERLMRDKERTMALRCDVAKVAIDRTDAGLQAMQVVNDMTKRYAIFWSKPIHLITNLGGD